jgi:hypothetical protein
MSYLQVLHKKKLSVFARGRSFKTSESKIFKFAWTAKELSLSSGDTFNAISTSSGHFVLHFPFRRRFIAITRLSVWWLRGLGCGFLTAAASGIERFFSRWSRCEDDVSWRIVVVVDSEISGSDHYRKI